MNDAARAAAAFRPPGSLPRPLSSFVGRGRESAEVLELVARTRLLTLTGAGGTGKTRLALHVAQELVASGRFRDGVLWIELESLENGDVVPPALAAALSIPEQGARPLLDTLVDALRPLDALIILDNCEHVLEGCARAVRSLLADCPGITFMATSRQPLGLAGETIWQVPPLSIPSVLGDRERLLLADAGDSDAVRLFAARAVEGLPSFRLSEDNFEPVFDLCRRLDGLPLAIELAAARVRLLGISEINARLDSSLQLLTRGASDAAPRHQSVRAAIDWSYNTLSVMEQGLLNRLSVFAGDFSLVAAEQICWAPALQPKGVLDTLSDLVDKSLVVVLGQPPGADRPMRYRLLEVVRQYARDRLAESTEAERVLELHLAWCVGLAEQAATELRGPAYAYWRDRVDEEHDNMRAALRWSLTAGRILEGLRLAAALHWFWDHRGYLSEGRRWLDAVLAADVKGGVPTSAPLASARAHALLGAAALAFDQGDLPASASAADASVALFRDLKESGGLTLALLRLAFASNPASERGKALLAEAFATADATDDIWLHALTRFVVGQGAFFRGDYTTARDYLDESLRLMRQAGDRLFPPRVLSTLGNVDLGLGKLDRARERLEEGMALVRGTGDPRAIALVAATLGDVARCQGDYASARAAYVEALTLNRRLGNLADVPAILHNLGYAALGDGNVTEASRLMAESLIAQRDRGNQSGVAEGLAGLAAIEVAGHRFERAARLYGAVEVIREGARSMVWPAERIEWNRHVTALRSHLNERSLTAGWTAGRAMNLEQAVDYALASPAREDIGSDISSAQQMAMRRTEKAYYSGLTVREREVAALIAQGKSNRAIADQMVISERTAERHVANILVKLDFNSRAQIAAWAVEKGLTARG